MDNLFKYLLLLVLTTMVFSCQNRPSEVLPRKKMENLMLDMYIAEAIIDNDYQKFALPENKEALINQVLEKHKTSEARWDTSLSWYSDKIDIYLQINDSVKARLQRNQKDIELLKLAQASENYEEDIKPTDYIPPHFRIAGLGCSRGFKFTIDSLQLANRFADYDTISFHFNTLGIYPMDTYSLKAVLRIQYSDTIIYEGAKLEENKSYRFNIFKQFQQDTLKQDTLKLDSLKEVIRDTIFSLDGFINLSGKFPPIPIQLYKISLDNNQVNDSSKLIGLEEDNKLLLQPIINED